MFINLQTASTPLIFAYICSVQFVIISAELKKKKKKGMLLQYNLW